MPLKVEGIALDRTAADQPSGGITVVDGVTISTDTSGPDTFVAVGDVTDIVSDESLVYSRGSSAAPYSTIFDDFSLTAEPVYNRYVPDEATDEQQDISSEGADGLPRYVILRWRVSPSRAFRPPSTKRVKAGGGSADEMAPDTTGYQLANGYVFPGVMSAVVDAADDKRAVKQPSGVIDEGAFLDSENLIGVAPVDVMVGLRSLDRQRAVGNSSDVTVTGKTMTVRSVLPSSPSLKIVTRIASSKTDVNDVPTDVASVVVAAQTTDKKPTVSVNFVDTSIGGLVDERRVMLASSMENVESIAAIAPVIANMVVLSGIEQDIRRTAFIPTQPAAVENGLKYVGYVIEKFKMTSSGTFEKVAEFIVDDPATGDMIDPDVAYGVTYRYRIRSLVLWTRTLDKEDVPTMFSRGSSLFHGEWCREWAYCTVVDVSPPPHPDEFVVRPESHSKKIIVTWKVPEDRQNDISGFVVLKKHRADGSDVSGWKEVYRTSDVRNGAYHDRDVEYAEIGGASYVYTSQTLSVHGEQSRYSEQIEASITSESRYRGENSVKMLSEAGVVPGARGMLSTIPHQRRAARDVFLDRVALSLRDGPVTAAATDKTKYVARITSNDTGQQFDLTLTALFTMLEDDTRIHNGVVVISNDSRLLREPTPRVAEELGHDDWASSPVDGIASTSLSSLFGKS